MVGTWARSTIVNGFHKMLHQVPRMARSISLYITEKVHRQIHYELVIDLTFCWNMLVWVHVAADPVSWRVSNVRLFRDWEPHVTVWGTPGKFCSQAVKFMHWKNAENSLNVRVFDRFNQGVCVLRLKQIEPWSLATQTREDCDFWSYVSTTLRS